MQDYSQCDTSRENPKSKIVATTCMDVQLHVAVTIALIQMAMIYCGMVWIDEHTFNLTIQSFFRCARLVTYSHFLFLVAQFVS